MPADRHYLNYASRIRAMRSAYIRDLLESGWNMALVFFSGLRRHGAGDHSLCGNGVIDTQHQRLSEYTDNLRVTILSGRLTDEANAIIDALIRDVVQHFRDEEMILAAANYPGTAKHAALHRELINGAVALVAQTRAGAASIGELFRFLANDILAKHMAGADREFASYLKAQH